MSSDEYDSDQKYEHKVERKEDRDKTIFVWDQMLDDPFCDYHGLDKVSAIDILVDYDKDLCPKGYYTTEEFDGLYRIASTLHYQSFIYLSFHRLLYTIIALREKWYLPRLNADVGVW